MVPLSSLLTFDTPLGRTGLPPPTTHLLATSTYPAPSNFLPLHYARTFLSSAASPEKKVVIWIGCEGASEAHHRNCLKKNGVAVTSQSFVYIDALEEVLEPQKKGHSSQSSALERLYTRVEEHLSTAARYTEADIEERILDENKGPARCLVILDDASALAWSITALDREEGGEVEEQIDHRVQMLRSKRRGAIQRDEVGEALARWMENRLRKSCDNVS